MSFKYAHLPIKPGELKYNEQLIKWLVLRGIVPRNKGIKILDLGSGRGHFYFALKKSGFKNVSAADISPEFDECVKADVTKKLPFKDGEFDLVISRDIAEHIRESENFFSEQLRILKKGGRIIVMTPNVAHLSLGEFFDDYTHVMPYTKKSLAEAFKMHGFENPRVRLLRAVPRLWKYTPRAFDFVFSKKRNNLLGVAIKP